jgi:hypothetical protein
MRRLLLAGTLLILGLAFVAKLTCPWLALLLLVISDRPIGAVPAPMPRVGSSSPSAIRHFVSPPIASIGCQILILKFLFLGGGA